MIKKFSTFLCICIFMSVHAQMTEISGKVIAQDDVENIHVINKTSKKYATTNAKGTFTIQVKVQDTLVFSSIQYKLKAIYIDSTMVANKYFEVALEEYLNELDQVTVGRVLTKNLESDVENSQAQPKINFYDVGIPGYKGKQPTQKERYLIEATTGGGIPLNPIINAITGRTKMLKNLVKLERRDELMYKLKANYSEALFEGETIEDHQKMEFWFFCSEDENFEKRCRIKNNLMILEFLQEKLIAYKKNRKE